MKQFEIIEVPQEITLKTIKDRVEENRKLFSTNGVDTKGVSYTDQLKKDIIKLYNESDCSLYKLSVDIGVSYVTLEKWCNLYGGKGIFKVKGIPHYSSEFKQNAIEKVLSKEMSIPQIAITLGISSNTLNRWIKEHKNKGIKKQDNSKINDILLSLEKEENEVIGELNSIKTRITDIINAKNVLDNAGIKL